MATQLQAGHAEITSTIALDATLKAAPSLADATARLREAWARGGGADPMPGAEQVPRGAFDQRLADLLNRRLIEGEPLCRLLLCSDGDPRIGVVAHHSALDGLGLVAALSATISEELGSSARGVDPATIRRAGPVYAVRRLREALLSPPTRIGPDRHAREAGDHLARADLAPSRITTPALAAGAAEAATEWNARRGLRSDRIVIAVGATRGSGRSPSLTPRAAWLRVRIVDPQPRIVRRLLDDATPEPRWTSSILSTPPGAWLARRLAGRTGSTLLVSNLGRLDSAGSVRAAAFYPMAHGRSGVSIGCVTARESTVITLRARRSDFGAAAAAELLDLVVMRLRNGDPASH